MKNKERVYILTYKGKNLKALRDILQKERLHRKLRGLSVTLQTEVTVYGESLIIGKAEMIQLLKGAKVKFEDGLKIKALSELITDKLGKAENPIAKAKRKEAKDEADKKKAKSDAIKVKVKVYKEEKELNITEIRKLLTEAKIEFGKKGLKKLSEMATKHYGELDKPVNKSEEKKDEKDSEEKTDKSVKG